MQIYKINLINSSVIVKINIIVLYYFKLFCESYRKIMMDIEEIDAWVEIKEQLSDAQKERLANAILDNKEAIKKAIVGAVMLRRLHLLDLLKNCN